ncbi:putative exopolysaccharide biosynthesis protein [Bradyrhizobium sp. ORS 375]|uniref:polysaccharide biosynthesis tyrosine autokinase n=1 Tax=Bradyrhizobium sp. (strain ORS 375) TaxID=566679 RepID=UPI0002409654|nr:polysaccharide biosynthesis tyrosine autokinase [Bradyrhizobium sp. ORS 375]CCD92770.1 putative exopolysaccharide biosynthesis protein [Bradyrhizobium sp. ORS 375]
MNVLPNLDRIVPTVARAAAEQVVSSAEMLTSLSGFLRRQYQFILVVIAACLCLGVGYYMATPSTYTATASLIIDSRKNQLFQQQSVLGDIPIDSASVESQVQIIKSETIALAVIKDLRLTDDSEFAGSPGLIGTVTGWIGDVLGSDRSRSEFDKLRRTTESFANRLTVRRVGLTYIIEIGFRSLSPDRAAQIANAVADAYVVDQLDAKYKATKRATSWLQDRIKELREQASAAERAVVNFKAQNNIVESGGRLMNEQQLAELNSQMVVAKTQVSEAKARLDRIEAVLLADNPESTVDGTVADTLNSQVVSKLRSQYLDLATREADWSARYGRNHLAAVNLRNQMAGIRSSIMDELRRLAESYKSDLEIANQRAASIEKQVDQAVSASRVTNEAQVSLRDLESKSQSYRALHDNFLQRYMESVQQQSFPITEARIITQASRPLKPSAPKLSIVLSIAGAAGLLFGFGLGRLRDLSDRVFRTTDEVEAQLQAHCLAILPRIEPQLNLPAPTGPRGPRQVVPDGGLYWHVVHNPFSGFTESVRAIKVAADIAARNGAGRVIGFTSSLPNEGKSTVAAGFAELLAQSGARTILIDGDLRNPSLTRGLMPEAEVGVLEVLSGKRDMSQVMWREPETGLDMLPAVIPSRHAQTSDVLASAAMRNLIDDLRKRYDYVVVDLSPLAPVVDVRTTTGLIDSYVFVVEWGRTKTDVVQHAMNSARHLREQLLGVVLNKAELKQMSRYGYGGYYRNDYYRRYGYSE